MGDYGEVWKSRENSENGQSAASVFFYGFRCAVVDGGEIGKWFDIKTAGMQYVWILVFDHNGLGNEENSWKL